MRIAFVFFLSLFCAYVFSAVPSMAAMEDKSIVKLQALDKSTARTETLQAKVGSTIEYGSLFIKIQSCRKSEPLDPPESAAFVQIWEVPLKAEKSEWVFSGWMFASSPALSAMDHAVYDVWVLDCLDDASKKDQEKPAKDKPQSADQGELEAPKQEPEEKTEDRVEEKVEQPKTDKAANKPKSEPKKAETAKTPEKPADAPKTTENPVESVIEQLQNFE